MSRIVYLNGAYLPEEAARVSIFDRGFMFADGVYEVTSVLAGRLVDNEGHMRRLEHSLGELRMPSPVPVAEIPEIMETLVALNAVEQGSVHIQITRGPSARDMLFPKEPQPTLAMFTVAKDLLGNPQIERGLRVMSVPDIRWGRRDIKTVQLLAPVLMKQTASEAGFDDAWMVQDGAVTEGTTNNAWIITREGTIVTRQLSNDILHGITRASVLRMAQEAQMKVEERPFTIAEAQDAAEAFMTSSGAFVMPVVEIDGVRVGDGRPGPLTRRLRELYLAEALADS